MCMYIHKHIFICVHIAHNASSSLLSEVVGFPLGVVYFQEVLDHLGSLRL